MKRFYITIALTMLICLQAGSQTKRDTVRVWNITQFSDESVNDMATDTEHWSEGIKNGKLIRYISKFATDNTELKANGNIIPETAGIYIGKGISSGNLLLCHNNGSANGVQMQNTAPIGLKDLKKGQTVILSLRSSSSSANGIAKVENLVGDVGSDYYTPAKFKDFRFDVVEDGDVSMTNSGGTIFNKIIILEAPENNEPAEAPEINVSNNYEVTLTSPQEGAKLYYTIVGGGDFWYSAKEYDVPFQLHRPCTIRAAAICPGWLDSDIVSLKVDVPLEMPFEGQPMINDPEKLGRGAIVTFTGEDGCGLINWRLLIDDPDNIAFNVYRDGTKLNTEPISQSTNWFDRSWNKDSEYVVETLIDGVVTETSTALKLQNGYLDIPINLPNDSVTESGAFKYIPGDCMVVDVDGDNEYEIVMKWDPENRKDNSEQGFTGNVLIDCYKMNGTQLWRINLGRNIRAGAHYTQLLVYDFDGDGLGELACKTAPGTIDGKGNYVILDNDNPNSDFRGTSGTTEGVIIKGSEYLTVFSGLTGEALATTYYNPSRDILSNQDWGDSYGNRCERYNACVAYLDGEHPSMVFNRGYYTASFLWAVDFDGKEIKTRWLHSSFKSGNGSYGEGAHSIQVADVDGDMRDEIIHGSCVIDDNGELIYRTGLGHGDAMHVGDFVPDRPGLEVMMVHEETSAIYGLEMHDALTGEHISGQFTGTDVGRGMCADIDPDVRGAEYWAVDCVFDWQGNKISSKRPSMNFRTFWDGDLYEELTERGEITKYVGPNKSLNTLVSMPNKYGAGTNVIKYTPCLQADIFGDWREEQIYYDAETRSHLWIFSTPYETQYRVPTLMHDHHYRMATIWQQSSYNQPPHLSFFLPDYIKLKETDGIENIGYEDKDFNTSSVVRINYYSLNGICIEKPKTGTYIEEFVYLNGLRYRKVKQFK